MSADWDINTTFAFWSLVVGVVGTGLAAWAFLPGWQDYQTWLKADPAYRQKTAAMLCHSRWVALYRDGLGKGLGWLDRCFGEANSARALGVCTVISLCYAWAAFFLGYGMGAPGRLGDIELLPSAYDPKDRAILVALVVVLPAVAFLLGRRLGGWADRAERRLKARLLRRRRRSMTRSRFLRCYRLTTALTLALAVSIPFVPSTLSGDNPPGMLAGMLFAVTVVFGILAARRTPWPMMKVPVAALRAPWPEPSPWP